MTTLKEYAREALRRRHALGDVEPITALAAQSVTAATLGGGVSAQKHINKWAIRRDAASAADRERFITSANGSTGALTHTGTAYSDTTVGTELLELHAFRARQLDDAINVTLGRLHRMDRTIFPTVQGQDRYWLDLDWVTSPSDIVKVCYRIDPVLSRNRHMDKWGSYSSGVLQPDDWTAEAGLTVARSALHARRSPYTVSLVSDGNDSYEFMQGASFLDNGIEGDSLVGKTITVVARIATDAAGFARAFVRDGTTESESSFHTGGGEVEELTASITVSADAFSTTNHIEFGLEFADQTDTAYVIELYLTENMSDAVRRDEWPETEVHPTYDQNALAMYVPPVGRMAQYVVYSKRPYPQFEESRIRAGTADSDSSDAPLVTVATGAISRLYEGMNDPQWVLWEKRFLDLAGRHLYEERSVVPRYMPLAPAARR